MRSACGSGGQQLRDAAWYARCVSLLSVAVCQNHAQREAIGVCVRCRARMCSECATKIDGINYCVSCLAGLAQAGSTKRSAALRTRHPAVGYASALLYTVLLSGSLWLLLEIMLPRG